MSDVFDDDWARKGALVIAACGLPLSVIARQLAVFVTVTLLVLYVIGLLALRFSGVRKRVRERETPTALGDMRRATARPRLAAPLVTHALLAALNLVVLVRRLDGPTMLFAALFFLFLLLVRTGRDAGVSFTSRISTD